MGREPEQGVHGLPDDLAGAEVDGHPIVDWGVVIRVIDNRIIDPRDSQAEGFGKWG